MGAEAKSGALAQLGVPGRPLLRMSLADMYAGTHGVAAVCAAQVDEAWRRFALVIGGEAPAWARA